MNLRDHYLCEGHKCPIRERCALHMHTPESYKRQVADYSQAPGFKPPNARESCGHFVELKEVDNG